MHQLSESQNAKINFILGKKDYSQQHALLKNVLGANADFFASPARYSDTTRWFLEGNAGLAFDEVLDFATLSNEDKDSIADYIEAKKAKISSVLSQEGAFKNNYEQLFLVPSENSIKVIRTNEGLKAILTEWACKSAETVSTIDPVGFAITRPRLTTANVLIEVFYTNGEPATDKVFYIEYLGRNTREKTNGDAVYNRGRCKLASTFVVYDKEGDKTVYPQKFEVKPEGDYKVYLPLFVEGLIKVVDQRNRPVLDALLELDIDGVKTEQASESAGTIALDKLEVGKSICMTEKGNPDNTQTHTIEKEGNTFILKVFRPIMLANTLKVINQKDEVQAGYPVIVAYNEQENKYVTNEEGLVTLDDLEVGKQVKIIDQNKIDNFQTYIIQEECEQFVLRITTPEAKFVTVRLLGYKGEPLPNIPIDFEYAAKTQTLTTSNGEPTEDQGKCVFPYGDFQDGEKVKATVHLPAKPKKNKKDTSTEKREKLVKKRFTFKAEETEYIIRLRRKRWLWWLLLLLLPLLLLIKCEKDVYIKVIDADTKAPVEKAQTTFAYQKSYLFDFDTNRFFTNDSITLSKPTDSSGVSGYTRLPYSVYSYLFKYSTKAHLQATCDCYMSDTLQTRFHALKNKDTLLLQLSPVLIPLDFEVVDDDDNEPLPDAQVEIVAEFGGRVYKDKGITTADGRVLFKKIPECATVKLVRGSLTGYFPDSLQNKKVRGLLKGNVHEQRQLRLKPVKKKIVFYVVDCETKEPIPDATVTIDFDHKGKKKKQQKRTNVNGVGKGEYDDAHIIADIELVAEKPYYKKGTLPKKYRVEDFLKLTKEQRTICLEAEEHSVEFINTDKLTGKPLSGVKNKVRIKRGAEIIEEEHLSDKNGKFKLKIKPGDKVSIVATYPPDYLPNTDKIRNKEGIKLLDGSVGDRTIPLKRKIKYSIVIYNFNKHYDEIFDVYLDGKRLGRVRHDADEERRTSFDVVLSERGNHSIHLKFIENGSRSSGDTGSEIQIMPIGLRAKYGGNNKSYNFGLNLAGKSISLIK